MRLYPALLSTVLLSGCLGTFVTPSSMTEVRPATRSPSPKARPQAKASTPASLGATVALPTTIRLQMPAPVISTGGGNVISTGGLNVISTGGLNVISTGGGNVISTGGGNYRVQAGSSFASLQATVPMYYYDETTKQIDAVLKELARLPLEAGKTIEAEDAGGRKLTVKLEKRAERSVVTMTTAAGSSGLSKELWLSYTSLKKGRVVMRSQDDKNRWYFATDFDLEKGAVTADMATDYSPASNLLDLRHWEFQRYATPEAGKVFTFKQWLYGDRPGQGDVSVAMGNYMADDRAAIVMGGREPSGEWFFFNPGMRSVNPELPHAFYLDPQGDDIASGAVPADLEAILPSDESVKAIAPAADPSSGDPFTHPAFSLSE